MESSRKEIASAKELLSMADASSSQFANDENDDWLYDDDPEEDVEEEPEDDFDDFDDEPVAKKKATKPSKKKAVEPEDEEEDDFEDDEEFDQEEKKADKPKAESEKKEDEELPQVPDWAMKVKELYPDRKFESMEDFDSAISDHINVLEKQIKQDREIQSKWQELAQANPGLDKFIEALELGESPVVAALKMGITPEDFEVFEEDEADAEKKVLAKYEAKKAKEQRIAEQKKIQDNIQASEKRIVNVAKAKSLDEKEQDALIANINTFVETVIKGDIPESFIEYMVKGIRFEKETKKAEEFGFIKGRNEKFKIEKQKRQGDGLPALQGGKPAKNRDGDDFLDNLDKVLKKFS